ncbi:MAG: SelL-related redox protein, partial [Planctomycetota bacterium]
FALIRGRRPPLERPLFFNGLLDWGHPRRGRPRTPSVLQERPSPRWMARVLLLAAVSHVVFALWVVLEPTALFSWVGLQAPTYPGLVQALGVLLGAFGVTYALAARAPQRLWFVVLTGLIYKVLLPVGALVAASRGQVPWTFGWTVLALGAIWWVPFGSLLASVRRTRRADAAPPVLPLDLALSLYKDEEGIDLLEASKGQPQFLVFLRHFGCTFCREALSDLSEIQERLRAAGARLVLVHMASESEARGMFDQHGVSDVTAISDPDRILYRAFALRRGSPAQLMGWSVWKRGWEAGVKQGHGIGWLRGDAAQMPGAFVVCQGRVVAQFIHETAADRPDYAVIVEDGVDQAGFEEELEQDGLGAGFRDQLRQLLTSESSSTECSNS